MRFLIPAAQLVGDANEISRIAFQEKLIHDLATYLALETERITVLEIRGEIDIAALVCVRIAACPRALAAL